MNNSGKEILIRSDTEVTLFSLLVFSSVSNFSSELASSFSTGFAEYCPSWIFPINSCIFSGEVVVLSNSNVAILSSKFTDEVKWLSVLLNPTV